MHYVFLAIAVVFEVTGTSLLPMTQNFTRFIPTTVSMISYGISFYFLTLALRDLPVAIVYATWSGLGVFLITLVGYLVYSQSLQWQAMVGMAFIVLGVVLVTSFSNAH